MELRQSLAQSFGVPLPVTLLYDHQSVAEIVEYVNSRVEEAVAGQAGAAGGSAGAAESDDEERSRDAAGGDATVGAAAVRGGSKPSNLLKLLRPASTSRPLFLAAPGVANAQSAYFAFSAFLQWSEQPIYVLDKDQDLDIARLAHRNALDILAAQPEGPYLIGGHSYGGAVAVEIALLLESWGHHVGLVIVMDTPRPEQVLHRAGSSPCAACRLRSIAGN